MAAGEGQAQDVRVAVLGTGIMGSAMTRNLVAAGLNTTVWDRSPSVTEPLLTSLPTYVGTPEWPCKGGLSCNTSRR